MAQIRAISAVVDDGLTIEANSQGELTTVPRRRGRAKGAPRPEGSGRKRGTPNRATRDVRAAAQKYTTRSLTTLVKLLKSTNEDVRLKAAREILDRAHGKPMVSAELTVPDSALAAHETNDRELSYMLAFIAAKAGAVERKVIEGKAATVDPFADQRADQAKRISAIAPVEPIPPDRRWASPEERRRDNSPESFRGPTPRVRRNANDA